MKKALIAIISVIYVIAIILVSFLGTRPEIYNKTVYVTALDLRNETMYKPNTSSVVVSVKKRPPEEEIWDDGKDADDVVWNEIEGGVIVRKIDYRIRFADLTYISVNMNSEYQLDVQIKPDDATKKDLTYYTNRSNYVSIDETGLMKFTAIPAGIVTGYLNISSTDMSGVEMHVAFILN